MELRKFLAPEFIIGTDARLLLDQYAYNLGAEKILIVTDKNLQQYEWFQDILANLSIDYTIFDDVNVNPRDFQCHLGADCYFDNQCNLIVAIGGGSVMDCAKGIGILVSNDGHIRDYEGVDQIPYPTPPLICIPTTSGSSADVSQFSIITHSEQNYKMVLASKMIVPDLSLLDPLVTLTKDFNLTIDVGLDALSHAVEAYVSNASSTITDTQAIFAIETVIHYLPLLAQNLKDMSLRTHLMEASLSAGLAFSNASLGLIHAMAHSLGGKYDLVHGELNGKLLEHVVAFNYNAAKEKYDVIHKLLLKYGYKHEDLPNQIHEFIESIRPNTLVHHDKSDLSSISEYVLKDPCVVTNPREVNKDEVVKIYEKIFE